MSEILFRHATTANHVYRKQGDSLTREARLPIYIDEDIRESYWVEVTNIPEEKHIARIH